MSKIIPLGDDVMLAPTKRKDTVVNGIVVLESSQDEAEVREYIVIEVGPRVKDVKVGQRVLVPRIAGNRVAKGDSVYHMVKESEVLCTVE